ncbi:MAG: hypothetical protein ACC726_10890 [Chloroflexota bacterium]
MDTVSRLLFQSGHRAGRISVIAGAVFVALAVALGAFLVFAGLAQPGPEPLIMAPLRW